MALKLKRAALAASTGGLSELARSGGLRDKLLGKKDPGTPDRNLELDESLRRVTEQARGLQEKALTGYGDLLSKDMTGAQIAAQERQVRQGMEDQQRQAQRLVARSGLGTSSVGLSALMMPTKGVSEKLEQIRASEPMLRLQNLQNISGGINEILGAQGAQRAFIQGQASRGRQGGLAPLLGAGIGGLLGGAGGARAGLGIGQAATQIG